MVWNEVAERPAAAGRHWPRFVAPVAIAALLAALGHPSLALAVLVVGLLVAAATTWSPAARQMLTRVFAAVSHVVGRVLTLVLLGLTELIVLVPVWLVQHLLPRRGPWAGDAGRWHAHSRGDGLDRHGFGLEPGIVGRTRGPVRRVARTVVLAVGAVVMAMVVDFALGATLDHLRTEPIEPQVARPASPASAAGSPAASPALADAPWAAAYYEDLARMRYDYAPFLYPQPADTAVPGITVTDGVRRSHQSDPPGQVPEVWLFGGSSLWGEGQRDEHTIASELVRLAEADGLNIRVTNLGAPGYGSWQEALLFERSLAHRDPPLLAAFYDGANDLLMQAEYPTEDPTHFEYPAIHQEITGEPVGVAAAPPDTSTGTASAFGPVWDRYVEASLVAEALRHVHSVVAGDATDATDATDVADTVGATDTAGSRPLGAGVDATDTAVIYTRSRALARDLADRDGVATRFFWQPVETPSQAYLDAAAAVAPGTIDLTGAIRGADGSVWIDGVDTNERGARLAAAAMWPHLREVVAAWYRSHGGTP